MTLIAAANLFQFIVIVVSSFALQHMIGKNLLKHGTNEYKLSANAVRKG